MRERPRFSDSSLENEGTPLKPMGCSSSKAVLDPVPGHIRFQLELAVGQSGTCCHVPAHNIDAERSCIKASSAALARLDAQEDQDAADRAGLEIERALLSSG